MQAARRTIGRRARALFGAWALGLLGTLPVQAADGTLLIVGGALEADNAEVHRALIDALLPTGPLVIVPAASGQPNLILGDFNTDPRSGTALLADALDMFGNALV